MSKLLIVDDDSQACEYLADYFARRNCTVATALSGIEGLKAVKKEKPDMVLLDVRMPDMDGLKLLQEIKKINKNIKVIIVTVASDENIRQQARELGADDFVRKPIQMDDLEGKVCLNISRRAKGEKQ